MKPRLLLSIMAAAALVIAGAAVSILAARQPARTESSQYPVTTRDPSEPPNCQDSVEILFDTDAEMDKASNDLENDTRFYNASFLTKAQNYERFKRTFADQPKLLELTRPESIPAVAVLTVSYAGQTEYLVENLKIQYGSAKVANPCGGPASSTRPVPTTATRR